MISGLARRSKIVSSLKGCEILKLGALGTGALTFNIFKPAFRIIPLCTPHLDDELEVSEQVEEEAGLVGHEKVQQDAGVPAHDAHQPQESPRGVQVQQALKDRNKC